MYLHSNAEIRKGMGIFKRKKKNSEKYTHGKVLEILRKLGVFFLFCF